MKNTTSSSSPRPLWHLTIHPHWSDRVMVLRSRLTSLQARILAAQVARELGLDARTSMARANDLVTSMARANDLVQTHSTMIEGHELHLRPVPPTTSR